MFPIMNGAYTLTCIERATAHKCHMFRFPWVPFIYRFDCIFILRFVFSLPPAVCRRAYILRYLGLLTYSGVQHKLWCVFVLFVFVLCIVKSNTNWVVFFVLCLRLVFCVWWCSTHIVLCFLFFWSSSCVLWMVVYNTYCVAFFVLFVFVLCTQCCQFLWIVHSWFPLRFLQRLLKTNENIIYNIKVHIPIFLKIISRKKKRKTRIHNIT